jgi:hypothetical protein
MAIGSSYISNATGIAGLTPRCSCGDIGVATPRPFTMWGEDWALNEQFFEIGDSSNHCVLCATIWSALPAERVCAELRLRACSGLLLDSDWLGWSSEGCSGEMPSLAIALLALRYKSERRHTFNFPRNQIPVVFRNLQYLQC